MADKFIRFNRKRKEREPGLPYRLEDWASIFVLILLLTDVTLQIIGRYVFKNPIGWTEEISRYLLIILTFVGGPIAVRKNSHVSLDFLLTSVPPGLKKVLGVMTDMIELVFYGLGTYLSWKMTAFSVQRYLVTIRISRSVVYGLVTLAFLMMTVRCGIRLVERVKGPQRIEEEQ